MKSIFLLFASFVFIHLLYAQPPGGGGNRNFGNGNFAVVNGHFYGKIVDSKTNKGLNGATVQLTRTARDSSGTHDVPVTAGFTQANGDFDFDNVPTRGKLTLRITNIGYADISQPVSLDPGSTDKDLGNIKMAQSETSLAGVTVTSTKPFFEMGVDRKVFNVDKNIVTTGQTATEVMKQIPSLNVDVDGNVTLRNAAPTIFVDGRPTTLTLDQIPADIIDRVEIVTNPSAKYDASGGNAGILNIVLKKNRKSGYNGNIRAGVDSRGRINSGVDLSLRQGKFNYSLSGNLNQRKSIYTTNINRNNFADGVATSQINQYTKGTSPGDFKFLRGGLDFFADNRNTFSVYGNYVNGSFSTNENQTIDSLIGGSLLTQSLRNANTMRHFHNFGTQLSYKHNFAKDGHDITADFNYNSSKNNSPGNYITNYYDAEGAQKYNPYLQEVNTSGYNHFTTIQTDYENQITTKTKIEAGARAAIRNFYNNNSQYYSYNTDSAFIPLPNISSQYKYTDQVYAAYATYTRKDKKWNYQLGLRAESSNYNGNLVGKDSTFKINYPISLFPSAFITYQITDKQDFQINYSRRINRPNFWQLLPFIDNTDPLNLSIGNPNLHPEFTNSFEVNYNYMYGRGSNLLISAYYKHSTNLITGDFYRGPNPDTTINKSDSVNFFSYVNANSSQTYGLELTNRITIAKFWDMTANINFYNSKINAGGNLKDVAATQQLWSYFAKLNNSFRFKHGYSIQLSGNYQSKTVLPASSGSSRNGGQGGGFGGPPAASAQGYIYPNYSFDAAVRKEWDLKKGNVLAVTISINDFARTFVYKTNSTSYYSATDYFNQISQRRRDPQVVRLNLNYRFGKFDASLFKRKNTKSDAAGTDMANPG